MDVEKRRVALVYRIIDEFNKAKKCKKSLKRYQKQLERMDVTVEEKKAILIDTLHELIIETFSSRDLKVLKENMAVLRDLVLRLKDINYYLETTFLDEIGLAKIDFKKEKQDFSKDSINRSELEKTEYMVYKLIERIVVLDNKLLKDFRKQEEHVIGDEEAKVDDISKVLDIQSELLCHLEAKLPPQSKVKKELLKKETMHNWTARVLALLSSIEHSYHKELSVFKRLKKKESIKKKLDVKIKHIIKEKADMLKLKESRFLVAEKMALMDDHWKRLVHGWLTASRL